jgi:transposase-like protein
MKCSKCGSTRLVKVGKIRLKDEWKQEYRCLDCGYCGYLVLE